MASRFIFILKFNCLHLLLYCSLFFLLFLLSTVVCDEQRVEVSSCQFLIVLVQLLHAVFHVIPAHWVLRFVLYEISKLFNQVLLEVGYLCELVPERNQVFLVLLVCVIEVLNVEASLKEKNCYV